ncbi:uncharacterized protein SPAPADRAFT_62054 [Spathaspora passalidarum NRRL Y-27907]|uniref:Large ribosomal subunit protein uL30m n=1 Tax=Spathaspora passalidarum (strain NRRL Y-27907 / 11-Y1) TaxID=619300 RepID=G3AQD6_SPAPN|nr:uncharacterized protein SPAPADRAFT_62054 [Spathaspora passalidarum NRRL Y-27907]EGW31483.1 hypothetical protein SPAPADRAFT_62054 [Spathaspora passalidarum NRRL Y-27907]
MSTAKQMYYKITQVRSVIGMPEKKRQILTALGLRKRNYIKYQKVDHRIANQLAMVKELVKVELTDKCQTRQEINQDRKFKPGFELVKGGAFSKYE